MLKWRASLYSPLRMFSITRGLLEFRPSPSSCALSMHPVEVFLSNTVSAALDNVWTECMFEPRTSLHPATNVPNHETTKRKFTPSWIALVLLSASQLLAQFHACNTYIRTLPNRSTAKCVRIPRMEVDLLLLHSCGEVDAF